MFMILGSPRSGTTLLARVISAHPDLVVPSETDFIPPACLALQNIENETAGREIITQFVLNSPLSQSAFFKFLDEAEIRQVIAQAPYDRRIITDLYDRLALRSGHKFGGDKSPNNLLDIRYLHLAGLLDADIKIIHIVRDIRDVVSSLIEQKWVADIDRIMPRIWVESNLYVTSLLENQPNYLLIRYEDFVDKPKDTAQAICRFLEVEYTDLMLDVARRDPMYRDLQSHRNIYRDINSDRISRFQLNMDMGMVGAVERSALEGMVRFGYGQMTIDPQLTAVYTQNLVIGQQIPG